MRLFSKNIFKDFISINIFIFILLVNLISHQKYAFSKYHSFKLQQLKQIKEVLRSEKGVNNILDSEGNSPLHLAVTLGNLRYTRLLLQMGANVNSKNYIGNIPLHIASVYNKKKIALELINNGTYVNMPNIEGILPIHYSIIHGNYEIINILIRNNSKLDIENEHGWTPLHFACVRGDPKIVRLLLVSGANPNLVNKFGRTALYTSIRLNQNSITEMLKKFGAVKQNQSIYNKEKNRIPSSIVINSKNATLISNIIQDRFVL